MNNHLRINSRIAAIYCLLTILLVFLIAHQAHASEHTEYVVYYDPAFGELPEGIAVDKVGNLYVSLAPLGEVQKITPGGEQSTLVQYDCLNPLGVCALGLAVDAPGNVYLALNSNDPDTHGVQYIKPNGMSERLQNTENISFPNALAFDKIGNLFVTDAAEGAIWRIPRGGSAEIWIQDELLEGLGTILPVPVGANGIAYWHGDIYVANTEKALIVRIPVLKDGTAGDPVALFGGDEIAVPDGIALDVHGNIYVGVVGSEEGSKIVRIDRTDGTFTTLATTIDGLNFPSSLAFGTGKGYRQSIFVANFAVFGGNNLPGVIRVEVDEPGLPLP